MVERLSNGLVQEGDDNDGENIMERIQKGEIRSPGYVLWMEEERCRNSYENGSQIGRGKYKTTWKTNMTTRRVRECSRR